MRLHVLLIVIASSLIAADKPKEEPKKTSDDLEGTWSIVKAYGGETDVTDESKNFKVTIKGKTLTLNDSKQAHDAKFKLDSAKKPKEIDFVPQDGRFKGQTMLGIYTLEGDILSIYMAEPTRDKRPAEIPTKGSANHFLLVLKRQK
jgi:uncharacterized protein (TIGR03067 family)